jgi:hypothetical protein
MILKTTYLIIVFFGAWALCSFGLLVSTAILTAKAAFSSNPRLKMPNVQLMLGGALLTSVFTFINMWQRSFLTIMDADTIFPKFIAHLNGSSTLIADFYYYGEVWNTSVYIVVTGIFLCCIDYTIIDLFSILNKSEKLQNLKSSDKMKTVLCYLNLCLSISTCIWSIICIFTNDNKSLGLSYYAGILASACMTILITLLIMGKDKANLIRKILNQIIVMKFFDGITAVFGLLYNSSKSRTVKLGGDYQLYFDEFSFDPMTIITCCAFFRIVYFFSVISVLKSILEPVKPEYAKGAGTATMDEKTKGDQMNTSAKSVTPALSSSRP